MAITLVTWTLALAATSLTTQAFAAGTSARHDLTAYAIASCLRQQPDAKIQLEGEGWASIIVERSKTSVDMLTIIAQAVKRDVGRGKADWVLHDAYPRDGVPIYSPYCHAIAERPLVKAAIDRAVRASGPNNRRR